MILTFDCYAIYSGDGKLVSIVSQSVGAMISYNLKEITKMFLESAGDAILSPTCLEYPKGCEIPLSI